MGEYFCSECGQRLVPNARFCASCGTAVGETATSRPGFSGESAPAPPPVPPAHPGGYVPPLAAYPPPAPYPEPRRGTNGYAIASLVLSIVMMCGIGSILAIVFGNMARRQIRTEGGEGSGLATAGIIIGWIGLVVMVAYAIFFLVFILNAHTTTTRTYP